MEEQTIRRKIEELNLMDDFLFNEAISDNEVGTLLAKLIIERATGIKLDKIVLHPQQVINGVDTDKHGIRMDVEVDEISATSIVDEIVRLYDIEPQNGIGVNLPKRSRYYQALRDVKLLDSGCDYDKLPEIWTIWILPYDPFGENRMVYSVKNCVTEAAHIEYNDGIRKLFLYINGEDGGNQTLKVLLEYLKDSRLGNAADADLKNLHSGVEKLKHRKDIEVKYMSMREYIMREANEARQKGLEEGRQKGLEEGLEEGRQKGLEEGRQEGLEEGRQEGLEEGRQEGLEEGRQRGLEQGEIVKLISMIHKKVQKGKSFERVADELEEEDSALIYRLYEEIVRYPGKTEEELYEIYVKS